MYKQSRGVSSSNVYYERVLYTHVNVFYSNHVSNNLVTELPNYLAAATDVIRPCEEDKVKWWRQQSDNLTLWSSAVIKVLLV